MEIVVVGYPRSGNVWLARLLGDALNCPVTGGGTATTFAAEGANRPGPHVVRQIRVMVEDIPLYPDVQFIHVLRAPRDVAVSISHFWNIPIRNAIEAMTKPAWPTGAWGTWGDFVRAWQAQPVPQVKYRELPGALYRLMDELELEPANPLEEVIQRQNIAHRRRQIQEAKEPLPFGKQRQLEHLYMGEVGRWRKEFSKKDRALAQQHFGDAW